MLGFHRDKKIFIHRRESRLWDPQKYENETKTNVDFRGNYFFFFFCMCPAMGWAINENNILV